MNSQQEQQVFELKPKKEVIAGVLARHNKGIAFTARVAAEQKRAAAEPGDKMPDGSICAGVSPDTGKKMFAMPEDASVTKNFNAAAEYVKGLNADKVLGHDDWRLPGKDELYVLFENQKKGALSGTFSLTKGGDATSGLYWSSTPGFSSNNAYSIRFNYGVPELFHHSSFLSVRCVR